MSNINDGSKTLQQLINEKNLALSQPQPIKNQISAPLIEANKNACQLAMLMWIGSIFFAFFLPLVVVCLNVHGYVKCQAKESLNVSITMAILYLVFFLMGLFLIKLSGGISIIFLILSYLLPLAYLIICLVGAVKSFNGEDYSPPFTITFFKNTFKW